MGGTSAVLVGVVHAEVHMQNMAGAVVHEGYIQYKPHVVDPEKICLHSPPSTGSSVRPSPPHPQLQGHRSDRPPPTHQLPGHQSNHPPTHPTTGSSVKPSPHTPNYRATCHPTHPHTYLCHNEHQGDDDEGDHGEAPGGSEHEE